MKMHCIPKGKSTSSEYLPWRKTQNAKSITLHSILGKDEQSEATHVIYPEGRRQENDCAKGGKWNEELVKNAFHVVDQWLEDSIKLKERQDEKLYRVR